MRPPASYARSASIPDPSDEVLVTPPRLPLHRAAGLFLVWFSFYALTGPGHLSSIDGTVLLQSARNLVASGSGAVPRDPSEHSAGITPAGVDGQFYPVWGPGLALAHIPTLVVSRHLEFLRPFTGDRRMKSRQSDEFYAPFTCAWLMAAAVVAIALCGCALGFAPRHAVVLASLMAVGSPLWHYARFDTNEPLQCAALAGATCCVLRLRSGAGGGSALFAGALLGIAVAAKAQNIVVFPAFALYAAAITHRSRLWTLACISLPLAISVAALGAMNASRYGSPFETGYHVTDLMFAHPLLDGVSLLLFSVGFGLLTFCPALIVLPFAAAPFARRFPREALLIGFVFASQLVISAKFYAYWGCAWGPRFLVPALPMLALLFLPLFENRGVGRRIAIAGFVGGVAIQAATIPTAFWGQVMEVWGNLDVPSVGAADARSTAAPPIETLLHSRYVAPPVVSLWMLANTRCRQPGAPLSPLTNPPWLANFPWRDPDAPVRLADLPGVDAWLAPSCLRPARYAAVYPSNPRLALLLLGIAAVGAALYASGRR